MKRSRIVLRRMVSHAKLDHVNTILGGFCIVMNSINISNENHVGRSIVGLYAGIFCIATTGYVRRAVAKTLRSIADTLSD